jgi:hypothetical protein
MATLKFRAEKYCSTHSLLAAELSHLKKTFIDNGYPAALVDSCLLRQTQPKEADDKEYAGNLVIPFTRELHQPIKSLCSRLNIHLLYKRSRNLGQLIMPRRPVPDILHQKNVIYKIPCKDCEVSYVGQTKRRLLDRINEHRTSVNKALLFNEVSTTSSNDLGIPLHCLRFNHSFDFEKVSILAKDHHWSSRLIKEAMHIALTENTCNVMDGKSFNSIWLDHLHFFASKSSSSDVDHSSASSASDVPWD